LKGLPTFLKTAAASRFGDMSDVKPGWREFYNVHPALEVFPRMTPDHRRKLAASINKVGLKVPIQTRSVAGEAQRYVIDGRNRLDAMELLGWSLIDERGDWHGALANIPGARTLVELRMGRTHAEIIAEVESYNFCRVQLSAAQQFKIAAKLLECRKLLGSPRR
jgi:hypothetical protein